MDPVVIIIIAVGVVVLLAFVVAIVGRSGSMFSIEVPKVIKALFRTKPPAPEAQGMDPKGAPHAEIKTAHRAKIQDSQVNVNARISQGDTQAANQPIAAPDPAAEAEEK